jgi:hypothetical protein
MFSESRLPISALFKAMIYFVVEVGNSHCARLLDASKRSIQVFYDQLRNIWLKDVIENPLVMQVNDEYEVDEEYDRHTQMIFLKPLTSRRIQSIVPVVYNKIPEGSIVYTDGLNLYNGLNLYI